MPSPAPGVAPDTLVTLRLPFTARCVGAARRALVRDLAGRGVTGRLVDDAVLVLSELVSNALRHARPLPDPSRLLVRWTVSERAIVRLEVQDGGSASAPAVADRGLGATGGRGLAIVAELGSEWGVVEDADSCTVWAVLTGGGASAGDRQQGVLADR